MLTTLLLFVVHWILLAMLLWVGSLMIKGVAFADRRALLVAALLLGLANAALRPVLQALALPMAPLAFGLIALLVNAVAILLVAVIVRGFRVAGTGPAVMLSLFLALASFVFGAATMHLI